LIIVFTILKNIPFACEQQFFRAVVHIARLKLGVLMKFLGFCATFFLALIFTSTAIAESSVWKISKDGDHFYLCGTFHLLSEADHPLPEEFLEAYDSASEVIIEAKVFGRDGENLQAMLMKEMMYQDGRTLSSELSDATYGRLKIFMESRNMMIEQVSSFKPWAVGLVLTIQEYTKLGMVPEYGVDSFLSARAIEDNKKLQGLESLDQHVQSIKALASVDPDNTVEYLIQDLETAMNDVGDLKSGWREGNLQKIERSAMVQDWKVEYPEMYDALIVERNNAWMKKLTTLFDDNAVEVVLVGVLHLVGQEGLLQQLEDHGFRIVQLD